MKIESVSIQNFKRFDNEPPISFKNETLGEVSNRFMILGDNGSGKTTLLQAIALPLAIATGRIRSVADFDWIGFQPGRYARWGTPKIELVVSLTDEEILLTQTLAREWYESLSLIDPLRKDFVLPGEEKQVRLFLHGEKCEAPSVRQYFQFRGRYYARQLMKTNPSIRKEFANLPDIFWFDQFRNLASSSRVAGEGNGDSERPGRISYEFGVATLREYLNGWKLAQSSSPDRYSTSYLDELERLYMQVFPDRKFAGVEQMPGVEAPTAKDFYFLLDDGRHTYDIAEMSAGEQAVFPILYEFVRLQIAHSVVLIDEIDLNLHPPAAQLLVKKLPKICPTCQFIFTTHSEAVSGIIGKDDTYRLPGGSSCL